MQSGLKILVVEENEDDYEALKNLIHEVYGDTVHVATVAAPSSAIELIDQQIEGYYDILFVAAGNQEQEAIGAVKVLTDDTGIKVPVVVMGTSEDADYDQKILDAGASDWLVKQNLTARDLKRIVRYATSKRLYDERIEHLAFHDPLTSLPNRVLLQDRLEQVLARVHRREGYAAIMFLDLDNFKTINDSLGHSVGDLLLREVAQRIKTCCRAEDTVARLGGDEFVILLPDSGKPEQHTIRGARKVANKVLKAISEPLVLQGNELHMTTSIGIAIVNRESVSVDTVLRQADTAMYEAKSAGKDSCCFFVESMEEAVLQQVRIESQLRAGLKNDEFMLHYQPIVDTESLELVGAEALVRWDSPVLGKVSPAVFVPIAETCGLIWSLGEKILQEACEFLAATPVLQQLSVNISSEQIHRPNFVPFIKDLVEKTQLKPGRLVFELTETVLLADLDKAAVAMQELREFGIRFALDDFGTGYSSLSYLKQLPFDYVKIDHSFTRDVTHSSDDQAIIDAILSLGKVLRFKVTAEGVETQEQLKYMQDHGCNTVQGYYFSQPLPAVEFKAKWSK